jgi:hypothetical protein
MDSWPPGLSPHKSPTLPPPAKVTSSWTSRCTSRECGEFLSYLLKSASPSLLSLIELHDELPPRLKFDPFDAETFEAFVRNNVAGVVAHVLDPESEEVFFSIPRAADHLSPPASSPPDATMRDDSYNNYSSSSSSSSSNVPLLPPGLMTGGGAAATPTPATSVPAAGDDWQVLEDLGPCEMCTYQRTMRGACDMCGFLAEDVIIVAPQQQPQISVPPHAAHAPPLPKQTVAPMMMMTPSSYPVPPTTHGPWDTASPAIVSSSFLYTAIASLPPPSPATMATTSTASATSGPWGTSTSATTNTFTTTGGSSITANTSGKTWGGTVASTLNAPSSATSATGSVISSKKNTASTALAPQTPPLQGSGWYSGSGGGGGASAAVVVATPPIFARREESSSSAAAHSSGTWENVTTKSNAAASRRDRELQDHQTSKTLASQRRGGGGGGGSGESSNNHHHHWETPASASNAIIETSDTNTSDGGGSDDDDDDDDVLDDDSGSGDEDGFAQAYGLKHGVGAARRAEAARLAAETRAHLERSVIDLRIYCKGYPEGTKIRALTLHVNAGLCRALGSIDGTCHIRGALPLVSSATACLLVFESAQVARAALSLDDALVFNDSRLTLRRPQGWKDKDDSNPLPPLRVTVFREEIGMDIAAVTAAAAAAAAAKEARRKTPAAMKPATIAQFAQIFPNRAHAGAPASVKAAKKKKAKNVGGGGGGGADGDGEDCTDSSVVLSPEARARVTRVRAQLKRGDLEALDQLCAREKGGMMQVEYGHLTVVLEALQNEGFLKFQEKTLSVVIVRRPSFHACPYLRVKNNH